jgi:hypothetical protein
MANYLKWLNQEIMSPAGLNSHIQSKGHFCFSSAARIQDISFKIHLAADRRGYRDKL